MSESIDLRNLEREAYRAQWSDGLIDIYLGLSLVWLGAMWTWWNDFSGLAGILPAVFVTPMLAVHRRFVEARIGHVEWRPARIGWERRNQVLLLVAGIGVFLVTIGALATTGNGGGRIVGPAILAWLLAAFCLGLSVLLVARRMLLYGVVLLVGGVAVGLADAEPGWPMLVCGVGATLTGLVMLRRFVERYPVSRAP